MGDSGHFQVRVEGIRFDAAHFATFGHSCEPLHGHSYEVAAEIDGALVADAWVVDFIALKSMLRGLCDELDHRFLLQTTSHVLQVEGTSAGWEVQTPEGRSYIFPRRDVVALPIDNTTAERLAQWLCDQLCALLAARGAGNVETTKVEVWEGPGQRASFSKKRLPLE